MEPLTRTEILQILPSLGVDIAQDTKLSHAAIRTRLRDALDAAQYKDHLSPSLNLGSLPLWPLTTPVERNTSARSVSAAYERGNLDEARQAFEGTLGDIPGGINVFMGIRKLIMSMAEFVDTGLMRWHLKDPHDEKRTFAIRDRRLILWLTEVASVLQVDEKTPALVVFWRPFDRSTAAKSTPWLHQQAAATAGNLVVSPPISLVEQKLLASILKGNAALVPKDFKVEKRSTETQFHTSVLLPIGPLEYEALSKLNSNVGCAVCGKKAINRCSQCQSASYCGAECQRADWAAHKDACRAHSLKNGQWVTVKTWATPFGGLVKDGMAVSTLNKYSNINLGFSDKTSVASELDSSQAPPKEYGDRLFLIKMQGGMPGMGGPPGHFMIYDRKRSFQSFMVRKDDPARSAKVLREMTGPRAKYDGCKMYRWAKRTGDWELSVCLDREPKLDACKW